eukprot:scaffold14423_cov63-Cyclotella_meneghiniana.AAC.3
MDCLRSVAVALWPNESCCLWQSGIVNEQTIFGCIALSNIDSRGLVRFYGNHNGIVFKDCKTIDASPQPQLAVHQGDNLLPS